jgi:hypothetical protein
MDLSIDMIRERDSILINSRLCEVNIEVLR